MTAGDSLSVGAELRRSPSGPNVYSVVEFSAGCVLLRCVWFGEKENLGDQIFCTREGQEIWVALSRARHFELLPPS